MFDYTEAGRVHIGHHRGDTMTDLVDAWWNDIRTQGVETVRMLASRRSDTEMLNHLARARMQAEGLLTGPNLETRAGVTLLAGDRTKAAASSTTDPVPSFQSLPDPTTS